MRNLATGSTWVANTAATVTPNSTWNGGNWTKIVPTTAGHGARLNIPLTYLEDGATYTIAFDLGNGGASSITVNADWCDTASVPTTLSAGEVKRVVFTGSLADYTTTLRFLDVSAPSGAQVYVKDVLIAQGASVPSEYFDGDTPGYAWDSEPHNSSSSTITSLVPANHVRVEVQTAVDTWLDVTGPTTKVSISAEDSNSANLSVDIADADLDPLSSDELRRGRPVRVKGWDVASWSFKDLFTGTIDSLSVKRNPREKRKVSISLTAVNAVSYLAGQTEPRGVATIDELRWLVTGVPFNINGATTPLGTGAVVSKNDNASIWDEVLLTRDTALGYAWVDKSGVLQAWDANTIDTSIKAVISPDVYSELNADWDATQIINSVSINFMRYNIGTETSAAFTYGPYVNQASIDQWGAYAQTFTLLGNPATESEATVAAHAQKILDRNSVAEYRPQSATVPFKTTHDLALVHKVDLNSRVSVVFEDNTQTMTMRVTGIKHTIEPDSWETEFTFAKADGVSSASTPPSTGYTVTPPGSIGEDELTPEVKDSISSAAQLAQDALDAANDAANFAQAKVGAFWQTTVPTGGNDGDIWFDTDDGNKMYRRTGGTWVAATASHLQTPNGRLTINTGGLTGYDSVGNLKVSIDAGTGAFYTSGPVISGGDISGATVTGGVVQTTSTANRGIKMNSSYLIAYDNSGNATFSINASNGAVAMKGDLTSGSTVTGAIVRGSTLSTSISGSGRRAELGASSHALKFYRSDDALMGTVDYINPGSFYGGDSLMLQGPGTAYMYLSSSRLYLNGDMNVTGTITSTFSGSATLSSITPSGSSLSINGTVNMNGYSISGARNLKNGTSTVTGFSSTAGQSGPQTRTVSFGTAFTNTPSVTVTLSGVTSPHNWSAPTVTSVSTTGFTVNVTRLAGSTTSVDFNWIAIDG